MIPSLARDQTLGFFETFQVEDATLFQKYLIPKDSKYVQEAMHYAAKWSEEENFFTSRIMPVSFAMGAVVLSAINAPIYLLSAPFTLPLNLIQLNPICLVTDFIRNIVNGLRSLIFVALGVTFIALGLLIPKAIFPCFAPEFTGTREDRLEKKCEELEKTIEKFKAANIRLERENMRLKEQLKGAAQ